jgi:glycosyltransferase involved in cell wall biosynthesis
MKNKKIKKIKKKKGKKNKMNKKTQKNPLVSVNIPTFNSEKSLKKCLDAVKNQTYKKIELLVIDSYSKDKTLDIAREYGCRIIKCSQFLLGARYLGAKASKGEFVLMLDSDQILDKTAIERAVGMMKEVDCLWLEERTYNKNKFLPWLFDADRLLVQKYSKKYTNPLGGVILPRFYRKDLLIKAMNNIPKNVIEFVISQDHAITYYEFSKLTKRIGKLDDAVYHIEPENLIQLFKKNYRYGKNNKALVRAGLYTEIIKSKNRPRGIHVGSLGLSIRSFFLRAMRAVPFLLGYYLN